MAGPSTSINGGELASLIVAITGVGYFVVNVIRKPKMVEADRLAEVEDEKTKLSVALALCRSEVGRLREEKRARIRNR